MSAHKVIQLFEDLEKDGVLSAQEASEMRIIAMQDDPQLAHMEDEYCPLQAVKRWPRPQGWAVVAQMKDVC